MGTSPALPIQGAADSIQIFSGTGINASGNGSTVNLPRPISCIIFELDLTAIATLVGDTLDVVIQTQIDSQLATPNWVDVVHFTQALGNGGAKRFFAKLVAPVAEAMFENGTALAAGSIRNILGDVWRVKYTVGGSAVASFTVHARVL